MSKIRATQLHTLPEVADHFRLSVRQIKRWLAGGEIKAVHIGKNRVRIPDHEVIRYQRERGKRIGL